MDKVKARSYPVEEWGGFVWAWLGEKTKCPNFSLPRSRLKRTPR